eukprot:CAMPEP_0202452204 /NCGR_PEP_ID=MMETSP1360-20130828/10460_1 /ASSEMBLY_ACC=CAM_ASM_000848 /TAXON_ID=515479 /ORGANISM="Licmophora paradoxa, Strain CCMP2313" /LENGTH=503 /DNA_ID=CAMNT_0049070955 /DNA_START=67 /DNA_END=1575 /DNA_ORIENTATION=+
MMQSSLRTFAFVVTHRPSTAVVSTAAASLVFHDPRYQTSTTTTTSSTTLTSTRPFSKLSASLTPTQEDEDALLHGGYKRPTVQWYPGHIAKAERQLSETLKAVDVVVEVRDARACKATSHVKVAEWCAGRPRIVVLTHVDQIPKLSIASWKRSYETFGAERWDGEVNAQVVNQATQAKQQRNKYGTTHNNKIKQSVSPVENVLFVDAKSGQGIHALHRAIFKAGIHIQERRDRRGLKERALRVGVIGYPNVGKSALINRILGRRRARTANTPGVTRTLQWIRVRGDDAKTSKKKEFELLDSPGVIPSKMVDQSDAVLLAACNCIGEAAYDNQAVASYLCGWLQGLYAMNKGKVAAPQWRNQCQKRYGFDPLQDDSWTGEDILYQVADYTCRGNPEDAARKILQDFRQGRMGPICLQLAPISKEDKGQLRVKLKEEENERVDYGAIIEEERLVRAEAAIQTAKNCGLELPPMIENEMDAAAAVENDDDKNDSDTMKPKEEDIVG